MEVDRKTYAGIFFDLDDTLIEGYIHPPQPYGRVVPLPGRVEMLAELRRAGIKLGIASNQGGVAFGYNTRPQAEQKRIDALAELDLWGRGVPLLMAFAHPDAPTPPDDFYEYRRRKPNPGMLLELAEHFKLSPDDCLFVGDRPEDQQAAANAGMAFCHAESFFADGYGLTLARIESMPIRPATLDRYMASAPWIDRGESARRAEFAPDPTGQALGDTRHPIDPEGSYYPATLRNAYRAHRIDSSENGPLGSPAPPRLPLDDQPDPE